MVNQIKSSSGCIDISFKKDKGGKSSNVLRLYGRESEIKKALELLEDKIKVVSTNSCQD